ncbi:hypothetical protein EcSMS35_3166 [Escherichia coli SMS-3-5]|uniref:Uncharacterized protein n=1 Tax=Escherichia coli (strain SMS-3-5 / SECEC) TaxID=439855 RepID=B1LE71_ECOSM|nr:hypothetical protein EcSMS35_3166 [Escherichia coli SMS-3-5]
MSGNIGANPQQVLLFLHVVHATSVIPPARMDWQCDYVQ